MSAALGSPAPSPSPDGPPERRFSRPRTSTIVLTVMFLAVFALWVIVRPPDPATASPAGQNSPGSSGQMPTSVPTYSPSPTHSPTPTHRPTPTRTPTRTPTPTRSPGQTPTGSPTTSPSPTATTGTGQVPGSPAPAQQSPTPSTGGAAAGGSPSSGGGTQAPSGVHVGVQTPLRGYSPARAICRKHGAGRRGGGRPGGC